MTTAAKTPQQLAKEEREKIKQHFRERGYGTISDETAHAQTDLLKLIRIQKFMDEE